MRLWSLHPKYLDRQALLAVWREGLLAQAVLSGETSGYRNHPQLWRFRAQAIPLAALRAYLAAVVTEAQARGYRFDGSKIAPVPAHAPILLNQGQLEFEWQHLRGKCRQRSPQWLEQWRDIACPECHPLFTLQPGSVEDWERGKTG